MPGIIDAVTIEEFEGIGVLEPPPHPQRLQFRHRTIGGVSTDADNIVFPWYWTELNHPALNDRPGAIVTVTPVGRIEINPQSQTARLIQNPHPVGVIFRTGRWYIYNLGLEAMELNADFHVAVHEDERPS